MLNQLDPTLPMITSLRNCLPFRSTWVHPRLFVRCVTRSLVLYVCFVDRCLSFCTFFFWPLCCLLFFYIRILITHLVSSNSSLLYVPHSWKPVTCLCFGIQSNIDTVVNNSVFCKSNLQRWWLNMNIVHTLFV